MLDYQAALGDNLSVHYTGRLDGPEGKIFDTSKLVYCCRWGVCQHWWWRQFWWFLADDDVVNQEGGLWHQQVGVVEMRKLVLYGGVDSFDDNIDYDCWLMMMLCIRKETPMPFKFQLGANRVIQVSRIINSLSNQLVLSCKHNITSITTTAHYRDTRRGFLGCAGQNVNILTYHQSNPTIAWYFASSGVKQGLC